MYSLHMNAIWHSLQDRGVNTSAAHAGGSSSRFAVALKFVKVLSRLRSGVTWNIIHELVLLIKFNEGQFSLLVIEQTFFKLSTNMPN